MTVIRAIPAGIGAAAIRSPRWAASPSASGWAGQLTQRSATRPPPGACADNAARAVSAFGRVTMSMAATAIW